VTVCDSVLQDNVATMHTFCESGELSCVMVALWNRADHHIFILWFLLLLFFPRLISAAGNWMSIILPHMVWP